MTKDQAFNIRLDGDLATVLRDVATDRKTSASAIIRELLDGLEPPNLLDRWRRDVAKAADALDVVIEEDELVALLSFKRGERLEEAALILDELEGELEELEPEDDEDEDEEDEEDDE